MAQEKIIIKFEPKGHKPLIDALNKLADAQRRATGESKKQAKAGGILDTGHKRLAKTNGLLANSFATLRSKMLLFSFAMSMGGRQLIQFTKQAAKVESMGRAFKTLSGGAESGSVAIEKLKFATDGTMNEFDLFQQANNAMILGVSKNSDEMAEMFDIAQRLGRALGRDTASSVESLITGIGRQSRLMLDNIGIIVKAEEAYDAYAKKLGISADKLTDAQKKQAFLNATMESARQKVASLGAETTSSQDSFDRFSATIDDLAVALGNNLKGAFSDAMDAFSEFINVNKSGDMQVALNTMSIEALSLQLIRFKNELKNTEAIKASANNIDIFDNSIIELTKNIEIIEERLLRLKRVATIEALIPESNMTVLNPILRDTIGLIEKVPILDMTFEKTFLDIVKESKLADKAISSLANEMARLVMEGENLTKIKPGKVIGQMVLASVFSGIGGFIGGGILSALGIAHKGGLITDNGKVQRFATGGTVRGGDNVPILAQGGEFVMQRSAVESIGIENLNRMNQGGGGSVTVNVSGNVLSQDFVEGELADQIKNAIRRGTDFGLS